MHAWWIKSFQMLMLASLHSTLCPAGRSFRPISPTSRLTSPASRTSSLTSLASLASLTVLASLARAQQSLATLT